MEGQPWKLLKNIKQNLNVQCPMVNKESLTSIAEKGYFHD